MFDLRRAIRERRDASLREMYSGGKGNAVARRYARFWAWAFSKGIAPGERWVTLEVPGRVSGKPTRFPLGVATVDGKSYLGSMLGADCNWVRNVGANDGYAVIHRRGARRVRLIEVPIPSRAPLLKAYVEQVPGARAHIPVEYTRPATEFEPIASRHPFFLIEEV